MNINNKKYAVTFAWLFIIVSSILYIANNLNVVSDMKQFMPVDSSNKRLQILLHEVQNSALPNLILMQVSGSSPVELAKASNKIKNVLQKNNELFEFVLNGDEPRNISSYGALIKYRYLLKHPDDFSSVSLRKDFKNILAVFQSGASTDALQYLLLDPQKTFVKYLSEQSSQKNNIKYNGVWFFSDKSKALLMVQLKSTGFNLDIQQDGINAIHNAVKDSYSNEEVEFSLSGPGTIAVATRDSIKSTTQLVSWVLTIIIVFLFWFSYRSMRLALLAGIPLMTSIIVASAITQIIFGELHGIVLAFGITMLGVCLDYPLHLFSHLNKQESAHSTLKKIWPTLRLGVATSILAYVALMGTGFNGLTQLAVFSSVGLIVALFVTRWFIPLWVSASWIDKRSVAISYPFTIKMKIISSILVIIVPLFFLLAQENIWSNDIDEISPIPAELRHTETKIREELNVTDANHVFLIDGDSIESVLVKTENLKLKIMPAVDKGLLTGVYSASDILPSAERQIYYQSLLPNKDVLEKNINIATKGLAFKKGTFDSFINSIAESKSYKTIGYEALISSPLGFKLKPLLFKQDGKWYSIIRVSGVSNDNNFNAWLNDTIDVKHHHISIHDSTNLLMDQYLQVSSFRLLGVLIFIVLIILWKTRKRKDTIWLIAPIIAGVVVSMAVQIMLGHLINVFHILSLLLVIGMGLDYSLFFNRDWKMDVHLQERTHAIQISAITTIVTFATLGLSDIPILTAMGQTVSVGILTCFIVAQRIAVPKASLKV